MNFFKKSRLPNVIGFFLYKKEMYEVQKNIIA